MVKSFGLSLDLIKNIFDNGIQSIIYGIVRMMQNKKIKESSYFNAYYCEYYEFSTGNCTVLMDNISDVGTIRN